MCLKSWTEPDIWHPQFEFLWEFLKIFLFSHPELGFEPDNNKLSPKFSSDFETFLLSLALIIIEIGLFWKTTREGEAGNYLSSFHSQNQTTRGDGDGGRGACYGGEDNVRWFWVLFKERQARKWLRTNFLYCPFSDFYFEAESISFPLVLKFLKKRKPVLLLSDQISFFPKIFI